MEQTDHEQEIRHISSQFLPFSEFVSFYTIDTGHINRTYQISVSTNGDSRNYLLQNLNTNVFKRPELVTHNIVRCASFLNHNCPNYPYEILTPVATTENEKYLLIDGNSAWRMFDFIADSKSIDRVTTTQEAGMIGEAFGTFLSHINHDSPNHYKITIPDFHNFTKRYISYQKYLSQLGDISNDQVSYLNDGLQKYAGQYIDLEQLEFPTRIIHHDTKSNNVLLDNLTGKPKCIIDLDTIMPGDIFSDFGDLMRTVFNPYEEDSFPIDGNLIEDTAISVLISNFLYPLNQMITNEEKQYLITGGKKITLLQVLRFLEDHLRGDVYYQVKYRGHNLDRALSQMYLYECLEKANIALP